MNGRSTNGVRHSSEASAFWSELLDMSNYQDHVSVKTHDLEAEGTLAPTTVLSGRSLPMPMQLRAPIDVVAQDTRLATGVSRASSWPGRRLLVNDSTYRRLKWLVGALAATGAVGGACYEIRSHLLVVLMLLATAFNVVIGQLEARWRLYAWRTPTSALGVTWPRSVAPEMSRTSFSIIVPARDEASVLGDTLHSLMRQDHPRFEIIVTLCDGDDGTIAVARHMARQSGGRIKVVSAHYESPSKAHQLNTALRLCSGDVVGVIDAEDDVAHNLLLHVESLFHQSGADIVQGGVQLMNLGDRLHRWFQVHNVMEYFFWFNSRMAYQAGAGFVPLGGNTVFVYRDMLQRAGGWPISLTEDCALGVRLCTEFGAKVATAYSAELATREEAPSTIFNKELGSLFWQRDRWIRGFLAELMGRKWLLMPTRRQRVQAGYILATPLLQGVSFVLIPLAIFTAIVTKEPIVLTVVTFTPFVPMGITIASQLVGLREFSRAFRRKASVWHYLSLLFLAPAYQAVLLAAAAVAIYKYASGDTSWYKTGRASQHRNIPVNS